MNALSFTMQKVLDVVKNDIQDGYVSDWYIEDHKLFVKSEQGWSLWYDDKGQ